MDSVPIAITIEHAVIAPERRGNQKELDMSLARIRRQARILALQILYEVDVANHSLEEVLERHRSQVSIAQPVRRYAERLVTGVWADRERIDRMIAEAAPAFPGRPASAGRSQHPPHRDLRAVARAGCPFEGCHQRSR